MNYFSIIPIRFIISINRPDIKRDFIEDFVNTQIKKFPSEISGTYRLIRYEIILIAKKRKYINCCIYQKN
jgi:hypothetical protein